MTYYGWSEVVTISVPITIFLAFDRGNRFEQRASERTLTANTEQPYNRFLFMPRGPISPQPIREFYAPVSRDLEFHALADAEGIHNEIHATPEDGRYAQKLAKIRAFVSEAALARVRMMMESEWFHALTRDVLPVGIIDTRRVVLRTIGAAMRRIADTMTLRIANRITEVEGQTRHDVIALLQALREEIEQDLEIRQLSFLDEEELPIALSFTHLPTTSEDITSASHALLLLNALGSILQPAFDRLMEAFLSTAQALDSVEDPATPGSSLGKRYRDYEERLENFREPMFNPDYLTMKFSGATGTHAALGLIAREGTKPTSISARFASQVAPELHYRPITAQINPHDDFSVWFGHVRGFCEEVQLICSEIWEDSGRDVEVNGALTKLLSIMPDKNQAGSSAMPHKIQVINIENALGTAEALEGLVSGLQKKINVNRLQRRLDDSRMIREQFGDVLPKILQILQNIATDLSKLKGIPACVHPAPDTLDTVGSSDEDHLAVPQETALRERCMTMRIALEDVARRFAELPFLARTHNQPASPTTVGKEFRVFAERFAYVEGLLDGALRGRFVMKNHSPDILHETVVGIVEHILGDLSLYAGQRNGLMSIPEIHVPFVHDASNRRECAEHFMAHPENFSQMMQGITVHPDIAAEELEAHYECLGEAVQTVLRRYGVYDAYEIVKKVARGAQMNRAQYREMIRGILTSSGIEKKVPREIQEFLLNLTPAAFTGSAAQLAVLDLEDPPPTAA